MINQIGQTSHAYMPGAPPAAVNSITWNDDYAPPDANANKTYAVKSRPSFYRPGAAPLAGAEKSSPFPVLDIDYQLLLALYRKKGVRAAE